MKILITGASGFLGSHVAEQAVLNHHQVRCLVRPSSDIRFLKTLRSIEFVDGSLDDVASLQSAVLGVDVIIHAAGITKAARAHDFYQVNVNGTVTLLNAVKQYAPHLQRFVLISSIASAGPSLNKEPVSELTTPAPVSRYGYSKLLAEKSALAFSSQVPITIIRPPPVYGPRDKNILHLFKSLRYGVLVLPFGGKTWVSVIYVTDLANAILKSVIIDHLPSGTIYFINDGKMYQMHELFQQLAGHLSKRKMIKIPIPGFIMRAVSFLGEGYSYFTKQPVLLSYDKLCELKQQYWICDSSKIRRELNWSPDFDWLKGSEITYHWYKQVGWL